ncbi:dienelactone hydrolase family protein [Paenibacillus thalictri]|uniref:Dienelactone hydrolase family protein n=1 Tax=Paenibacillus thalictri TaxID=2527873 RepID=A0A4Q9DHV1_9BACL|nr:dienelactone hydrolase family protein [Paenibacillus thalictri]TBL72628.1 dienelactone hydrolase family protein [Paenibacillus thalictri]
MNVHAEWTSFGEGFTGYLARPEGSGGESLPAVVVLQEIWGVDPHIQDVTRRFAALGYVAFAPDLYAKDGQRPEPLAAERVEETKRFLDSLPPAAWGNPDARQQALDALPAEQGARIGGTLGAIFSGDRKALALPAIAAAAWLRSEEGVAAPKVAAVGFCLGGMLSAQLACRDPQLAGAIVFYGAAPEEAQIPGIACPVLGIYGELDKRLTEPVPAFAEAMRSQGKSFDYVIYDDAPHAFFNDTRASYRAEAAQDAFRRAAEFLQRQLGA